MGFTLNTSILRTPTGILKILEIVLVLIVLMICRFGNDGHRKTWGSDDDDFLGQGTTVGYAIIVPAVLLTYLLGANLSILELFINFVGGVLFIAVGALAISYYQHYRYDGRATGIAMGVLAIITGIVFLIDFIFAIKNTRFSVVQTRIGV
eukprot:GFUD01029848.1.p1 GENE.GFUD01029848.1~~GFUD01029848.1.p1  ORF type:complete len:162 (+),score=31.10 GFUD01029848.1:37-486(+)